MSFLSSTQIVLLSTAQDAIVLFVRSKNEIEKATPERKAEARKAVNLFIALLVGFFLILCENRIRQAGNEQ